tara:strand:+ start:1041195 stop:1044746 length:3552 start_codon:yes stop_codon:yes gene_type:complete
MIATTPPQNVLAHDESCLSQQDIHEFSFGRLPTDRFESALRHLESCATCQQRAESCSADFDSFANVLGQRTSGDDSVLAEPDCQAAIFHVATSPSVRLDAVMPPIDKLGPYRLLKPLGRGGMGSVFLAEHERLQRKCAIKLLPRERGFDVDWRERFDREMQAVASLQHPNIVAATDAGEADGWHYLVMEYLDGLNLAELTRRLGPIPIADAISIMIEVCQALSAIHDAGLVHRDVKPSNVMLTREGTVKLLDLGLVFDGDSSADMRLTTVGHVLGTLAFAAPEQLSDGQSVDARADLYGIGATLFQLIAGEPAHGYAQGIAPLVIDKTSRPARTLRSVVADVPEKLDALVAKLLDRERDRRPTDSQSVALQLARIAPAIGLRPLATRAIRTSDPDSAIETSATPPIMPASPPPKKPRARWLLGGFAAAAIAAIVMYVQTDRGTLVIESPLDDLTVSILREETPVEELKVSTGANRTTLRSGTYTVQISAGSDGLTLSDESIQVTRGADTVVSIRQEESANDHSTVSTKNASHEKLYQGKPMAYWTNVMRVERDVETLGDAMDAIASLAEPNHVDAVQSILVTARRFGGLAFGKGPDPSYRFMQRFREANSRLMPQPAISAITDELPVGTNESRLACVLVLQEFLFHKPANLVKWATAPFSQADAEALHNVLRLELKKTSSRDEKLRGFYSQLSLHLALALDRSVAGEPELRESIEAKVASIGPTEDRDKRLAAVMVEGRQPESLSRLTITESLAAEKLDVSVRVDIVVRSLLADPRFPYEKHFHEQRNRLYLAVAEKMPEVIADETLIVFGNLRNAPGLLNDRRGGQSSLGDYLLADEEFWITVLPIVAMHTTRPDIAFRILNQDVVTRLTKFEQHHQLVTVVKESLRLAKTRAKEMTASGEITLHGLPSTAQPLYQAESPDKTMIAFVGNAVPTASTPRKDVKYRGLFCFDRITFKMRRLSTKFFATAPEWSSNSSRIAIVDVYSETPSYQLAIVDVETGKLTETKMNGFGVAWSPDDRFIACTTQIKNLAPKKSSPGDGRIGVYDTKTEEITNISPAGFFNYDLQTDILRMSGGINPIWSPDGQWIAWTQHWTSKTGDDSDNRYQIWCARRDGSAIQLAFDNFEKPDDVRWSDDGKQIIDVNSNKTYDVVEASDLDRNKWPKSTDNWFQHLPENSAKDKSD